MEALLRRADSDGGSTITADDLAAVGMESGTTRSSASAVGAADTPALVQALQEARAEAARQSEKAAELLRRFTAAQKEMQEYGDLEEARRSFEDYQQDSQQVYLACFIESVCVGVGGHVLWVNMSECSAV